MISTDGSVARRSNHSASTSSMRRSVRRATSWARCTAASEISTVTTRPTSIDSHEGMTPTYLLAIVPADTPPTHARTKPFARNRLPIVDHGYFPANNSFQYAASKSSASWRRCLTARRRMRQRSTLICTRTLSPRFMTLSSSRPYAPRRNTPLTERAGSLEVASMQAQRNAFPLLRLQQLIRLGHKLIHTLADGLAGCQDALPLGVKGAL